MSLRGRSSFFIIINRFIESLKPKNVFRKGKHVSDDYLGNNYYEIEADPSRGKRTPVRWFRPPNEELWDRTLPPEWDAWLRLRRTLPPTKEEIDYNLLIESQKKRNDKQIESQTDVQKKHSFSTFPTYNEYEESPGFSHQKNNNEKKTNK